MVRVQYTKGRCLYRSVTSTSGCAINFLYEILHWLEDIGGRNRRSFLIENDMTLSVAERHHVCRLVRQ
jgi:hypothetical protein